MPTWVLVQSHRNVRANRPQSAPCLWLPPLDGTSWKQKQVLLIPCFSLTLSLHILSEIEQFELDFLWIFQSICEVHEQKCILFLIDAVNLNRGAESLALTEG